MKNTPEAAATAGGDLPVTVRGNCFRTLTRCHPFKKASHPGHQSIQNSHAMKKAFRDGYDSASHEPSLGFRITPAKRGIMAGAHTHVEVEVNCVLSGKVSYSFAGSLQEISAGEVGVFWGGLPHRSIKNSHDIRGICISLPFQCVLRWKHASCLVQRLLGVQMIRSRFTEKDRGFFEQWKKDYDSGRPKLREIILTEMEAYFSRLSLSLEEEDRVSSDGSRVIEPLQHIAKITDYVGSRYAGKITVKNMADFVGLNPKYILTLFHRTCHLTLWEYVIRVRLGHAEHLLLTTDRTITDIALEVGFHSLNSFYEAFRKYYPRTTPSRFRRSGGEM